MQSARCEARRSRSIRNLGFRCGTAGGNIDDLADANIFLMRYYSDETHFNVGSSEDIPTAQLASMVSETLKV